MNTSPKQYCSFALLLTFSVASSLHATQLTWDADPAVANPQDGPGLWNTATNTWWDGAANIGWNNSTPDSAMLGTASGVAGIISNTVAITVANITFNPPGIGTYTITAAAANPITLSGNPTITANADGSLNAVLAGTGFTKEGASQLSLRPPANNTYIGATIITAGTLALNSSTAGRVLIPGNLIINSGATVTNSGSSGPVADTAIVTVNSGANYALAAGSETISSLVLDGGTLSQSGTGTLICSTVDARIGNIIQLPGGTGKLDCNNFAKSTSGTVTLSTRASAAATGGMTNTVVNAGSLILDYTQNSSKLNDTGSLTVNGGTLIQTNGTHTESVGSVTLSGGVITNAGGTVKFSIAAGSYDVRSGSIYTVLQGAASLSKTTAGTVVLAAANAYGGGTTITEGTLQLGDGNISGTISGAITNNSTLVLSPGSATAAVGGVISGSGSLVKTGSGTAAVTAVNSYQGSTTISNGVLGIDGDATLGDATGTLTLAGGTLSSSASRNTASAPVANPVNLVADSAITTTSASGAGATVDLNLSSDSVTGSGGTLTFRNDAASGNGIFAPRFSGSGFDFNRPIVIVNGSFGSTRLDSFNTLGTTQTFSGVISGDSGYRRNAAAVGTGGATIFSANNTYSGPTDVTRGLLLVNGTLGTNLVTVSPTGTLGGNGTVNGPVIIQSGGTLSAGTSIGRLTISNSLVFQATGTNVSELNKTLGTNDLIRGLTSVNYNGILVVNNLSGTLAANDTFKLFDAASYTGSFASSHLPALDAGLAWDLTGLTLNGTIKVTGTAVNTPQIASVTMSGGNLILAGSGGTAGADYYVLAATNAALPLAGWKSIATNQFIAGGHFIFTNAVDPLKPSLFYLLQIP